MNLGLARSARGFVLHLKFQSTAARASEPADPVSAGRGHQCIRTLPRRCTCIFYESEYCYYLYRAEDLCTLRQIDASKNLSKHEMIKESCVAQLKPNVGSGSLKHDVGIMMFLGFNGFREALVNSYS